MKRLFTLLLLLALAACKPAGSDPEQSAAYNEARKSADAGDGKAAAAFYQQTLDEFPKFARAHLDRGLLCDEKLADPIAAIYHYRRYLELEPNGDKRKVVEEFIERSRLSLAAKLPQGPGIDTSELLRLQNQNTALATEIAALKSKLAEYDAAINAPALPAGATPATPPTPTNRALTATSPATPPVATNRVAAADTKPRVHVVQKGDTLFSIALRYYGSRSAWEKIYQANRDALPNRDQIKIGQQLVVP
jgi:LysM repeat protein